MEHNEEMTLRDTRKDNEYFKAKWNSLNYEKDAILHDNEYYPWDILHEKKLNKKRYHATSTTRETQSVLIVLMKNISLAMEIYTLFSKQYYSKTTNDSTYSINKRHI